MGKMAVSFCVPTRNRIELLKRTLDSIFNLEGLDSIDWVVLVGDDSTDDITEKYVKEISLKNPRILYYRNPNKGQFNNLNFLTDKANDGWIVYLHDDDIVLTQFLKMTLLSEFGKDQEVDCIWTGRNHVDGNCKKFSEALAKNAPSVAFKVSGAAYLTHWLKYNDASYNGTLAVPMVTGLCIKKTLSKDIEFDQKYYVNGDSLFIWKVLYLAKKPIFVNQALVDYMLIDTTERAKPSEAGVVYSEIRGITSEITDYIKNKEGMRTFYKTAIAVNSPLTWTAVRYKGDYLKRIGIQMGIIADVYKNCPEAFTKIPNLLIVLASFAPQFVLKSAYKLLKSRLT